MSEIIEFPDARQRKKRRKNKLTRIDVYKRICILGLAISVIIFTTKNPEILDISRTFNSISYIFKKTEQKNRIDINNVGSIIEFDGSVAMIDNDYFKIISADGFSDLEYQIAYANPQMIKNGHRVLVYDKGGYSYSVFNKTGRIYEKKLESQILNANISAGGNVVIITNESGYRGVLIAYDKNQREVYKWSTSDYYIMDATITGNNIYVSTFYQDSQMLNSKVLTFDFDYDKIVDECIFENELITDINFLENGKISLISSKNIYLLDKKLKIAKQQPLYNNILLFKYTKDGVLYVEKEYTNEYKNKICFVSLKGKNQELYSIDDIKSVSLNESYMAVLTKNSILIYNNGGLISETDIKARDIVITGQGLTYVLYSDYIELLKSGEN